MDLSCRLYNLNLVLIFALLTFSSAADMGDLKSKLIGSWELVSYIAIRVTSSNSDGRDVIHPMTEEAAGVSASWFVVPTGWD